MMRPVRLALLAGIAPFVLLVLPLASMTACGPSFQAIYEGDARFEHCYALEENPNVAMQQKGECWRDWLAHYTYGQTRDRVMYAHARAQAIRRPHELPTDEALMHAAPGEVGARAWSATPAPTSAFTPPPKTWGGDDAGTSAPGNGNWSLAPAASVSSAPGPAPGTPGAPASPGAPGAAAATSPEAPPPLAGCTGECDRGWSTCRGACKADGCETCTKTYKACLRTCAK
ncbi:hypothetical protein [Pendulispora albinea]|uniref:Uncharacterized protein n=1 Tax=Pendulispora albinea TaxID=2741071 RepID=A0ABZ2M355_9BACT